MTIAALLRISAVENGPREKHFRDVDLAAVCAQAVEFYEPLAEAKSIALTASLDGAAVDSRRRGFAARSGLQSRRKRRQIHARRRELCGSRRIASTAVPASKCATPDLASAADRELIFRRFYRAAAGGGEAGHGLGLSIARTIAELHGFDLRVEDNSPGARFVMRAAAKATLARAS